MLLHLLPAICASVLGAAGCQDQPTVVRLARAQADLAPPRDTALAATADTYIRRLAPNQNRGSDTILRLRALGKNRALLRWDQQALVQAAAGGTIAAARLELTIVDLAENWPAAGRPIELHRLTHDWTELGATWNCAVDTATTDHRPSCSGATAWDMDDSASYPWVASPIATAILKNGQTGVVTFDVTADVLAWLGGQANDGWILKKTVEGDPGMVDFSSRESAAGPRLALTFVAGDTARPELPDTRNYFFPADTAFSVASPGDTAIRYYRTVVGVLFDDTTSGVTVRRVFADYRATIIGGLKNLGAYIVRVPDPGPSYAAVDSLINKLSSEPGVRYAFGAAIHDAVRRLSRFPSDGTGAGRLDWLAPAANSITWPQLAVRATLAWGCETGTYGGDLVDVGVLDETFDPSPSVNPDLAPSLVTVFRPTAAMPMNPDYSLHTIADFSHGTAVAGLLTAAGDNDQGVAGMTWKSRLHVFLVGRSDSIVADAAWYLANDAFPAAAAAGARVLSSSIVVGGNDFNRVQVIQDALQRYIKAGRGALFVQAVGDERTILTIDALKSVHSDIGLLQAAVNIQQGPDGGRVLIVAGTQPSNTWWDDGETFGSNFIRGATEIAAPAANIVSLANRTGTLPSASGTSYSAPLVAGVAAQLWAMDPDLTPGEVKGLILDGAKQKRLSSTTGDSVAATPVSGAPQTIYQLDAYGALTLLSATRPGTPVCGFPVGIPSDGQSVVLERPVGPERLNVGSDTVVVQSISVAQGGRLISSLVYDFVTGDIRSVVTDQGGAVLQELPGVQRVYLERDVVDGTPGALGLDPTYTLRPGTGASPLTIRPFTRLPAPPSCAYGLVAFSPSGSQLIVALDTWVEEPCLLGLTYSVQYWLIPTDSGQPARLVWTSPTGSPNTTPPGDAFAAWDLAWSHDGRRAIATSEGTQADPGIWKITSVTADGTAQDLTVPANWNTYAPYTFTADDSAVVSIEWEPSTNQCFEVRRDPTTWDQWASRPLGDCFTLTWRAFPTAPPARPTGIARAAARGAFSLAAAATPLTPSLRLRMPIAPSRRVQVN